MDARVKARRTLELDMRQAIVDGGFELHYQPVVDLRSNEIVGCEALLRWRHPGARHDLARRVHSRSRKRPA